MSTGAGGAAGYPVGWEADVLLRDGRPVHLRPMAPGDADRLRAFHASLSDRTVYFRFFSAKPTLTDEEVARFTQVDHRDRVALAALDGGELVGVGRYDAVGDGLAEVAFVIRDDMQGRGLGSVLLEHLAAAARECGLTRFTAEVLPQNGRMLATFRQAGFALDQRREDDVIALAFDIEPTASSREVMAAREQRADARSVHRLLHPGTVAVVGAGRAPGGLGHALLGNLVRGGFRGRLIAVHREVDEILGVPCVRSLAEVDGAVDLCVVVVPAPDVRTVIEQAAAAGAHGVVVVSGGFADAGGDGPRLQQDLVELVRGAGMRLVGPNALGLINTDPEVRLNASLVHRMPRTGAVGFFSQSGALGGSILDRLEGRGLGVSTFVSAGNRADISGNDVLQYWLDDDATSVVLLHLETIGNPRKFARLVRRAAARKPVLMVRAGGAE
ncbi:MAG: GNAT family N-acetyltransferase, partial [Candidatus Nanopelagicales bacterium]